MKVVNQTRQELPDGRLGPPWPHAIGVVPMASGQTSLVVAIKLVWRVASFAAAPPELQSPVQVEDRFDERGCLVRASELMAIGTGTNIVVDGGAQSAEPFEERAISIRVGRLAREAVAFGPRHWERRGAEWTPSRSLAVRSVPLDPTVAFGGSSCAQNPVGIGFLAPGSDPTGAPLPQVELAAARMSSPYERPEPALFGAVPPHWSPRRELGGTYGERWRRTQAPLLAADCSARFFDCADAGLVHRPFLRGGESISIRGLSLLDVDATLPRFEFRLVFAARATVMRLTLARFVPAEDMLVLSYVATMPLDRVLATGKAVSIVERWVIPRDAPGAPAP